MQYKGYFRPKFPQKYLGNPANIVYRSGLELSVMLWCDKQDSVVGWFSEELFIPYICPTDNKPHRYFIDFLIKFNNDKTFLIEVKPYSQTKLPKMRTKKPGKRYINEVFTYTKNQAKWKAAAAYAESKGWQFTVWTEKQLKDLGIR